MHFSEIIKLQYENNNNNNKKKKKKTENAIHCIVLLFWIIIA